ncbi:hypothetical protein [Neobacillus vireti]
MKWKKGVSLSPNFVDGYIAQAIMEAVERSSEYKSWDYILTKNC